MTVRPKPLGASIAVTPLFEKENSFHTVYCMFLR